MTTLPELVPGRTGRGFAIARGIDRYGGDWSVQDSSLAEEPCIWLGHVIERAHLTKAMVAELLPYLHRFVATGSIADTSLQAAWDEALRVYQEARAVRDALPMDHPDEDAAVDRYCEAMDRLVQDVRAPNGGALAMKLEFVRTRWHGFSLPEAWLHALMIDAKSFDV